MRSTNGVKIRSVFERAGGLVCAAERAHLANTITSKAKPFRPLTRRLLERVLQRDAPTNSAFRADLGVTCEQMVLDTLTNGAVVRSHVCGAPF